MFDKNLESQKVEGIFNTLKAEYSSLVNDTESFKHDVQFLYALNNLIWKTKMEALKSYYNIKRATNYYFSDTIKLVRKDGETHTFITGDEINFTVPDMDNEIDRDRTGTFCFAMNEASGNIKVIALDENGITLFDVDTYNIDTNKFIKPTRPTSKRYISVDNFDEEGPKYIKLPDMLSTLVNGDEDTVKDFDQCMKTFNLVKISIKEKLDKNDMPTIVRLFKNKHGKWEINAVYTIVSIDEENKVFKLREGGNLSYSSLLTYLYNSTNTTRIIVTNL